METWELDVQEQLARITFTGDLTRPLGFRQAGELAGLLESLDRVRSSASVVMLNGQRGAFLPDCDQAEIDRFLAGESVDGDPQAWHRVTSALASLPQPTVAVIDGPVAGVACPVVLACTFRVASDGSLFGPVPTTLGVVGTDTARFLVPLLGASRAALLLMTGEEATAADAERVGLVNVVLPGDGFADASQRWCRLLADVPADELFTVKQLVATAATCCGCGPVEPGAGGAPCGCGSS